MNDKNYLKNGIKISFQTSIIASLEVLETELGFLWGHGKSAEELTEEEEYYRHIWEQVRSQIFEKSNKSKNIALSHVDKYSIRKRKVFDNFDNTKGYGSEKVDPDKEVFKFRENED